jgi:hypothetical protein
MIQNNVWLRIKSREDHKFYMTPNGVYNGNLIAVAISNIYYSASI